jgi:hypothetical protein
MAEASLAQKLQALSQTTVFFAHQSVGQNLLDGLRRAAEEAGVALRIEEGRGPSGFTTPGIVHTRVGKNEDPLSKLSDFAALLEEGPGDRAKVALMKLCYVDFNANTQAEALFSAFRQRHAELQARFGQTRLVPVTAPLTTVQRGLKAMLRNRIGTGAYGERENVQRHRFNELLRREYAGALFDLAAGESGTSGFEREGKRWPCLRDELTDDGGHLNAQGQRVLVPLFVEAVLAAASQ